MLSIYMAPDVVPYSITTPVSVLNTNPYYYDFVLISLAFAIGMFAMLTLIPTIPIVAGFVLVDQEGKSEGRQPCAPPADSSSPTHTPHLSPLMSVSSPFSSNQMHNVSAAHACGLKDYDEAGEVSQKAENNSSERDSHRADGSTNERIRELPVWEDRTLDDDDFVAQEHRGRQSGTNGPLVVDVWEHNLFEELENLRQTLKKFRYIAFDTEYPGFVKEPCGRLKPCQEEQSYEVLRENVGAIKLIQLGICCKSADGVDEDGFCWQFHFEFDREQDLRNESSIQLLTNAGIDWGKHRDTGISFKEFGMRIREILVEASYADPMKGPMRYIVFHGMFDFGFLVKLFTQRNLPHSLDAFLLELNTYFPSRCDLKFLLNCSSSLQNLAFVYNIPRVGNAHQAGSDALMTSGIFFALSKELRESAFDRNALYGLYKPFYSPRDNWLRQRLHCAVHAQQREETANLERAGRVARAQWQADQRNWFWAHSSGRQRQQHYLGIGGEFGSFEYSSHEFITPPMETTDSSSDLTTTDRAYSARDGLPQYHVQYINEASYICSGHVTSDDDEHVVEGNKTNENASSNASPWQGGLNLMNGGSSAAEPPTVYTAIAAQFQVHDELGWTNGSCGPHQPHQHHHQVETNRAHVGINGTSAFSSFENSRMPNESHRFMESPPIHQQTHNHHHRPGESNLNAHWGGRLAQHRSIHRSSICNNEPLRPDPLLHRPPEKKPMSAKEWLKRGGIIKLRAQTRSLSKEWLEQEGMDGMRRGR